MILRGPFNELAPIIEDYVVELTAESNHQSIDIVYPNLHLFHYISIIIKAKRYVSMFHSSLISCTIGDTTRILNAKVEPQQTDDDIEYRIRLSQSTMLTTNTITLDFLLQYGYSDSIEIKSISFGPYEDVEDIVIIASGIVISDNYGGTSSPPPGFIPLTSSDSVTIKALPYDGYILAYATCSGNLYDSNGVALPSYIEPSKFPLTVTLQSSFESGNLNLFYRRY